MKVVVTFEAEVIPGASDGSTWPTLQLGRCMEVRVRDEAIHTLVENASIEAIEPEAALRLEEGWPWRCSCQLSGTPHAHPSSGFDIWRDNSAAAEAERQRQR